MWAKLSSDFKIANHPAILRTIWTIHLDVENNINQTFNQCERILATVKRWEGWDIKNDAVTETNREHVLWMLDLVDELYKPLSNICNIEDLIIMILVHDLWEYKIGDIAQTEKNAEGKKVEQKDEEKNMAIYLINQIKGENLKNKCLWLLGRYFNFSLKNKNLWEIDDLYLVVKLLDTVQWYIFGLENIFQVSLENDRQKTLEHMKENYEVIHEICRFLTSTVWSKVNKRYAKKTTTEWIYIIVDRITERIDARINALYWEDFHINTFKEYFKNRGFIDKYYK